MEPADEVALIAPDEDARAAAAARGAVLAGLGACEACHTAEGGPAYAGGYGVATKFGTFYTPNLTSDAATGLGAWSYDDFVRAMRKGRDPSGRGYAASFPYVAYSRMSDADLADLWAYLQAVPPVSAPAREHDVRWPYATGFATGIWRRFEFDRRPVADERGEYLATGPGHCGECHTPRNALGGVRDRREFQGNDDPPEPAPDITSAGLSGWSVSDLVELLTSGQAPDDDVVSGPMRDLVRKGTSQLSSADREALAAYVLSVPPSRHSANDDEDENEDEDDE